MSYKVLKTLNPVPEDKVNLKEYTMDEVAKHNQDGDLWIVIDCFVYDLSNFVDIHPGGAFVLLDKDIAGKNVTEPFFSLHKSQILTKYSNLMIGVIPSLFPNNNNNNNNNNNIPNSDYSNLPTNYHYPYSSIHPFSPIPYSEPLFLSQNYKFNSTYYTPSHISLAKAVRVFVEEYVRPDAVEKEETGERPSREVVRLMARNGINYARLGPGKHLHGMTLPGGMKGEDFDYFGELIITQELARTGKRGYWDGLQAGMWIGLTPILNYGTEKMKQEIIPPVLAGEKFISLAISEPFAGSDVAGIQTRAEKWKDEDEGEEGRWWWIVNGCKKWITNGTWADYFSTTVRTSENKLSMILIPRCEGVETKGIKTSYSSSAGTAYVTFDNVKVPFENLIGTEGEGMKITMANFNHERWNMAVFATRQMRLIVEDCFKWAHLRKAFGKRLIDQPVIRQKFAKLFTNLETTQSFLESITYQMCTHTYSEQSTILGGPIALLKTFVTRAGHEVADEAVQIMGGRGITKGGMGELVEGFQRGEKFDAILGGAEEVLNDLGVRQAMRKMPNAVL